MKRLAKLPTSRYIFDASEPMPEPQPRFDGWIVQQHEPVRVEHVEQPNIYVERMELVSRIAMAITAVLIASTIVCQLAKRREVASVARVQWGAQLRSSGGAR